MDPGQKNLSEPFSNLQILLSPYKDHSFIKNIYGAFLENIITTEISDTRLDQYLTKNAYTFLIYLIHKG